MEKKVEDFLVHGGRNTEYTIKYINKLLEKNGNYPAQAINRLLAIRTHAEEDYQHYVALQTYLSSQDTRGEVDQLERGVGTLNIAGSREEEEEPRTAQSFITDQQEELDVTTQPVGTGDDLFLLEGVDSGLGNNSLLSPSSPSYSDGEGEQSDADEGIHLPRKHTSQHTEIACSLPVGIPLSEQMMQYRRHQEEEGVDIRETRGDNIHDEEGQDIAASIQAMARSVATSTMFGDPMFDLPRPRVNTASKI